MPNRSITVPRDYWPHFNRQPSFRRLQISDLHSSDNPSAICAWSVGESESGDVLRERKPADRDPRQAMSTETSSKDRRYPRISTPIGVWVEWECAGRRTVSRVRDLNAGGVFIETQSPSEIGSELSLLFFVPEGEIRTQALVRNLRQGDGMGVEFTSISQPDSQRLVRLIQRLSESNQPWIAKPKTGTRLEITQAEPKSHTVTNHKKILSIANIPTLAKQRESLLKLAGYDVTTVRTVVEAIAALTSASFDLVIVGHAVPAQETGAIEAFVRRAQDVPILFLHPGRNGHPHSNVYFDVIDGSEAFLKRVASLTMGREKSRG